MPFVKQKASLIIDAEEKQKLEKIINSRTETVRRVRAAKVLLGYIENKSISTIANESGITRQSVYNYIDKALEGGVEVALGDLPRAGRPVVIPGEAKTWILSIACKKPTEFGYASETWTYSQLVEYIKKACVKEGHRSLKRVTRSMIFEYLQKAPLQPHKVTYYLEKRDPDFDIKMAQVLHVYKEIELINKSQEVNDLSKRKQTTLSYDEKPGIQAIANVAAELMPQPGRYPTRSRDYEYKRLGTVSFLAGIDLHDGRAIGIVRDKHRSKEFVEYLELVDQTYNADWKIRIILDNHTAHISKETRKYLSRHANRFEFVFTPKHGSWLNIVETFFSKMTRSFLRHIRVSDKKELVDRIYKFLDEVNECPVVFKWTYKMEEIKL